LFLTALRIFKAKIVGITLLAMMLWPPLALADYVSHQVLADKLIVTTEQGQVSLTAFGEEAIEVLYFDQAKQQLPSFAIAETSQAQAFHVEEKPQKIKFHTNKLTAVINKSPFSIAYYKDGNLLLAEEQGYFEKRSKDETTTNQLGFRFTLAEHEKLLGGGERVLGMDRRGHKMPLYNKAHYGYTTSSNQMYFGLPAVMSSNQYILLFDNSAKGNIDLGKTESNIMQFDAVGGRSAYVVFSGDSYPDLIHNYVKVTGKQPLPPRWALGNYASRFGYRSEQEVRATVDKFIAEDFPLDALILDLYWFGKDIKGHMGNLAWDKTAFPTPTKMISDLQAKGVNTIVITEPFILTGSKKWSDAVANDALAMTKENQVKTFDFYFGNTGLVDVFNPQAQDWFNQTYQSLYQQGVKGWWGDLGEPEVHPKDTLHTLADGRKVNADEIHNVYGHQWAKMVFNKQLSLNPEQRPFIMMRSGFAGSQRYGMLPWTGDVSRSWDGLKPQVELSLQMGVLGMAYTHSDLGGFAGGEVFDAQMYTRWLQYGVFQPVYRPHAQDNIAPEPIFHDKKTKDILREFIKLRYKLLPYNYSLAYQNSTTGMPLMRPMFFEDSTNLDLIDNKESYFWGDAFLVTPVTDADVKSVPVSLPAGVWFDFWTDKKYQGQQQIHYPVSLETIPVLVRAGSFIPMIEDIQSTQAYASKQLTLHYYADNSVTSANGMMFEDDGKTFQTIKNGQFELLHFKAKQAGNIEKPSLNISLERETQGYQQMPIEREVTLVIHHWQQAPTDIKVADININVSEQLNSLTTEKQSAYWDKATKTLSIKFTWQHQPVTITIH